MKNRTKIAALMGNTLRRSCIIKLSIDETLRGICRAGVFDWCDERVTLFLRAFLLIDH